MSTAHTPFEFMTVASLTKIGNQSARNLSELLQALEECSDASVFHHTFQTLGSHHFLTEGFSNDFAQWVLEATSRDALAEQLASLDIRDYLSIAALRADLCRVLRSFTETHVEQSRQEALEPFYFCETVEVTLPLGVVAQDLPTFRHGVAGLSHASFHFHFVTSRLRLQLQTNDFSYWLAASMGLTSLAEDINRIDIYTNTLDSTREKMLLLLDRERRKNEHTSAAPAHPAR